MLFHKWSTQISQFFSEKKAATVFWKRMSLKEEAEGILTHRRHKSWARGLGGIYVNSILFFSYKVKFSIVTTLKLNFQTCLGQFIICKTDSWYYLLYTPMPIELHEVSVAFFTCAR